MIFVIVIVCEPCIAEGYAASLFLIRLNDLEDR